MDRDEYAGETFERPTTDLRDVAKFDMLIDKLVRVHPYVNSKKDARAFINGEFESPVPESDIRMVLESKLDAEELGLLREKGAV